VTIPIFVDPAVLAFVGLATGYEEVGAALGIISELSYLSAKFDALIFVADPELELTLYESGAFPFHEKLVPVLSDTGWSEIYDPSTILALINGLIQRLRPISDFTTAQALVIESLSTVPNHAHLENQEGLRRGLSEGLAFLCSGIYEGSPWVGSALMAASTQFPASTTLEVECDVALVEPEIGIPPVDAFAHSASFLRVTCVLDVLSAVSARDLWHHASSDVEIAIAVAARANQLRAAASLDPLSDIADRFVLGTHFRASLAEAQASRAGPYAMATLDTCARLCGGLPQPDDNPFYTSAGSGVQRVRTSDGALARRVHVTKTGIGVRLMYWRLPSGIIEFSNAGPKAHELIFQ
jgi:hypothetical protein